MSKDVFLTGNERFFDKSEMIVSKTDTKGIITYANSVFAKIASYGENELIGKPHSIVRHPDMPRCVFKLLWDTILSGKEIFAYVLNKAKNGDHYWVYAHVTPSFDASGKIIGYHSNRRVPDKRIINETIIPVYKMLSDEEKRHSNSTAGMNAAFNMLVSILNDKGVTYDEFVQTL